MHAIKRKSRSLSPRNEKKEEEEEVEKEVDEASETFECSATQRATVPIESLKNIFETTNDSLATEVQNRLQTSEGVASPLDQKSRLS